VLRTLRHRDFRLLWMGQSVSLIGDGIYLVAIAWLVYDISNEPGALAIVGLARTTLGLAGAVGLLTFFILYVPGVRDPERRPLPGPRAQAISST
jgi:Transmembrane secretion effector